VPDRLQRAGDALRYTITGPALSRTWRRAYGTT